MSKKSIVFCHGIWADGSCFNKVIPTLQAEGYEVLSAQYGLDSNQGDVAAVKRTLGRVSSPAILVGHSYGGSVITAAGTDERVAGLVYIAALAPDEDETSQSLLTNGASRLQTNEPNSTCRPSCHGHTLPPSWSKACNPARSGGVYDHHHRVDHGVVLRGR